MSRDFYFTPKNVRIGTDFRDKKEQWYLQINLPCHAGLTIKISKKEKDNIIKFVKDHGRNLIDEENTNGEHL
jgi:hypothetical protein